MAMTLESVKQVEKALRNEYARESEETLKAELVGNAAVAFLHDIEAGKAKAALDEWIAGGL